MFCVTGLFLHIFFLFARAVASDSPTGPGQELSDSRLQNMTLVKVYTSSTGQLVARFRMEDFTQDEIFYCSTEKGPCFQLHIREEIFKPGRDQVASFSNADGSEGFLHIERGMNKVICKGATAAHAEINLSEIHERQVIDVWRPKFRKRLLKLYSLPETVRTIYLQLAFADKPTMVLLVDQPWFFTTRTEPYRIYVGETGKGKMEKFQVVQTVEQKPVGENRVRIFNTEMGKAKSLQIVEPVRASDTAHPPIYLWGKQKLEPLELPLAALRQLNIPDLELKRPSIRTPCTPYGNDFAPQGTVLGRAPAAVGPVYAHPPDKK